MSRKKAKKESKEKTARQPTAKRLKGRSRAEIVLTVVATDNTFVPNVGRIRPNFDEVSARQVLGWMGRCIHCNTHVYVTSTGETSATIEHIRPLCNDGHPSDPRNLALACLRCNNEKGIRHDRHVGKHGRADEVIAALQSRREERWRSPVQQ